MAAAVAAAAVATASAVAAMAAASAAAAAAACAHGHPAYVLGLPHVVEHEQDLEALGRLLDLIDNVFIRHVR